MIPLARDAIRMYIYRSVPDDDRGDVIERWERTEQCVLVSFYPISSTRMQIEDGQVHQDQCKFVFPLKDSMEVSTGDRLGDLVGPVWYLLEVKISKGHASCIGVKL